MFASTQTKKSADSGSSKFAPALPGLAALPPDSPVPECIYPRGYCAAISVNFDGAGLVSLLLKVYPPIPLVEVRGTARAVKPASALRGRELFDNVAPVWPVLYKSEEGKTPEQVVQSAIWWTTLPCGVAQIIVRNVNGAEARPDPAKFERESYSDGAGISTLFVRKLAPLADLARVEAGYEEAGQRLKAAIAALFKEVAWFDNENALFASHVEQRLRKETGLAFELCALQLSRGMISVWTRFGFQDTTGMTVSIPVTSNGRRLLIQDIPVEYV